MGTVKLKNLIGSKKKVTPSFREVFLFGSVLREDFRSAISDVDLGLIFSLEAEKSALTRCEALTSLRSLVRTWEGNVINEYQLESNAPRISPLLVTDVEVERDIVKKVEAFFLLPANQFHSLYTNSSISFEVARSDDGRHRHAVSVLKKVQEVRASYVKVDRFGVYRGDLQDCSELESLKPLFRAARTLMADGDFDVDMGMLQLIQVINNGVDRESYPKDCRNLLVQGLAGRWKKKLTAWDQMFLWEVLADEAYRVLKGQATTSKIAPRTVSISVVEINRTRHERSEETSSPGKTEGAANTGGGATEKTGREDVEEWLEELRNELENLMGRFSDDGWDRVRRQFKRPVMSRGEFAGSIVREIPFLKLCEGLQEVQRHVAVESDFGLINRIIDRVLPLNHDRQFIQSLQQANAGTFFRLGLVGNEILGETVMAAVENRSVELDLRRGLPDMMFTFKQSGEGGPEVENWSRAIILGIYENYRAVFQEVNTGLFGEPIEAEMALSHLNVWAQAILETREAIPYCVVRADGDEEESKTFLEAVERVADKLGSIRFLQQICRSQKDEHRMVQVMTIRSNRRFKAV